MELNWLSEDGGGGGGGEPYRHENSCIVAFILYGLFTLIVRT